MTLLSTGDAMELKAFVREQYAIFNYNCNEAAIKQMLSAISMLEQQHGRVIDTNELCDRFIMLHLHWLKSKGRAASTIARRRGHFMTMWKSAARLGMNSHSFLDANVQKIAVPTSLPQAWSLSQLQVILTACREVPDWCKFGAKGWEVVVLIIYYTGLRISTVLQLRREHLTGNRLHVPHEIMKDKGAAEFRLPADLCEMIEELKRPDMIIQGRQVAEHLVPWPYRFDSITGQFRKKVIKRAGLPDSRYLKFHAIRRTVATVTAAREGEERARQVLGHSSISTTRKYIADPSSVDPSLKANFSPVDIMPAMRSA